MSSAGNDDQGASSESDYDDDEDDEYGEWFESIRTKTGLEIGVKVKWPNIREFSLSTTLEETEFAPMFHGTQWAGTRVWRAAVVALQYLLLYYDSAEKDSNKNHVQKHEAIRPITSGTSILELGCGLGVPGMLLHEITKCPIVLTDKDTLVGQLRHNIQENFTQQSGSDEGATKESGIRATALDWSLEGVDTLLKDLQCEGFDIVLNCDCVYEPLYGREAWQALVACQEALLRRNPNTVLITSLERRKADGVENYIEALGGIAQHVERLDIPFEHSPEVEMFIAYGAK